MLTFKESQVDAVRVYRDALVADGWAVISTYANEPVNSASTAEKDGWVIMLLARDNSDTKPGSHVISASVWGPDRAAVASPLGADGELEPYSQNSLEYGLRYCEYCDSSNVPTKKIAFESRVCADCEPEQSRVQMYPGWCS